MAWHTILVAIGSNLPGADGRAPLHTCTWAASQLAALPGLHLDALSRWYETEPVPPSGQPPFVNGVARLSGTADPPALLAALHGIEAAADRVRTVPNAARTLDLDLIGMDGLVLRDGPVRLPHPRMAERAFVLAPLCDVAPGWVHPVLGRAASVLLHSVRGQVIWMLRCPMPPLSGTGVASK